MKLWYKYCLLTIFVLPLAACKVPQAWRYDKGALWLGARMAHMLGREHTAATLFGKAVAKDPADSAAVYNLATSQLRAKDYVNAMATFKQAAGLMPKRAEVYYNMGYASQRMGEMYNALVYWQKALLLQPGYAKARHDYELLWAMLKKDFGDAGPDYPTTADHDGALHIIKPSYHIGEIVDSEPDAEPDKSARSDDRRNKADEDGVLALGKIMPGAQATFDIKAGEPGYLSVWADINHDGHFDTETEYLLQGESLNKGENKPQITIPKEAAPESTMFRFRYASVPINRPWGLAPDGEVEDHLLKIDPFDPNQQQQQDQQNQQSKQDKKERQQQQQQKQQEQKKQQQQQQQDKQKPGGGQPDKPKEQNGAPQFDEKKAGMKKQDADKILEAIITREKEAMKRDQMQKLRIHSFNPKTGQWW